MTPDWLEDALDLMSDTSLVNPTSIDMDDMYDKFAIEIEEEDIMPEKWQDLENIALGTNTETQPKSTEKTEPERNDYFSALVAEQQMKNAGVIPPDDLEMDYAPVTSGKLPDDKQIDEKPVGIVIDADKIQWGSGNVPESPPLAFPVASFPKMDSDLQDVVKANLSHFDAISGALHVQAVRNQNRILEKQDALSQLVIKLIGTLVQNTSTKEQVKEPKEEPKVTFE